MNSNLEIGLGILCQWKSASSLQVWLDLQAQKNGVGTDQRLVLLQTNRFISIDGLVH